MSLLVIRIDIFISSPSDLVEERNIIRKVIEKINRSPIRDSYFLVPLLYEDEVPPEIGKEAQLIVDRYMQVQNSYILISLLWTRMGTPFTIIETKEKYESGTQYEILKGYENFQEKGWPHILLYRKEKENPSADPVQKEKVTKFFDDFMGNPPKLKGLFAKYTDPAEFEAKVEDHLIKLIQKYPPKAENCKWLDAPEFKEEPRRIDAAMPRQTAIGENTPVKVMICLSDSKGLKGLLPEESDRKYEIEQRDVQASGLTVAFPLDKRTGRLRPLFATIEIDADDFKVKNNAIKIQLNPGLDSGQFTFNLIPLRAPKYSMVIVRLKCNALDGSEIECGSVILYTVIKNTKAQMSPRIIWDLVSHSLTGVSLLNKVTERDIRVMSSGNPSLIFPSYPVYSSVQAGPNGPIFLENQEISRTEIYAGNVVIDDKFYKIHSLKISDYHTQLMGSKRYAWIKVNGESMNAALPIPINNGDYILIDIDNTPSSGDIVVASLPDETGSASMPVVKRYFNFELISESTSNFFPPIQLDAYARIIGKVVAIAKLETSDSSNETYLG